MQNVIPRKGWVLGGLVSLLVIVVDNSILNVALPTLVTDLHAQECLRKLRFDLEPSVRRPFRSLPRRLFPPLQC